MIKQKRRNDKKKWITYKLHDLLLESEVGMWNWVTCTWAEQKFFCVDCWNATFLYIQWFASIFTFNSKFWTIRNVRLYPLVSESEDHLTQAIGSIRRCHLALVKAVIMPTFGIKECEFAHTWSPISQSYFGESISWIGWKKQFFWHSPAGAWTE